MANGPNEKNSRASRSDVHAGAKGLAQGLTKEERQTLIKEHEAQQQEAAET